MRGASAYEQQGIHSVKQGTLHWAWLVCSPCVILVASWLAPGAAELPIADALVQKDTGSTTQSSAVLPAKATREALQADSRHKASRIEGLVILQRSHRIRAVEGREERSRMTISAALQSSEGQLAACTDGRPVPVDDTATHTVDDLEVLGPVTCKDRTS